MVSMVVVDASVWVARLVPQDKFHLPAKEWLETCRADHTRLVSPSLLLPEVCGAVARRTQNRELALSTLQVLQTLPELQLIEMERGLIESAAQLSALLGLRGADAIYVAAADYLNLPLCTLDEEQSRRAAYKIKLVSFPSQLV